MLTTALALRDPVGYLGRCRDRYGDVFTLRFPALPPLVYVCSPDEVRRAFQADPERLRAGEANSLLEPVLGPSSLLLLDGARHLRERKLLLPPFQAESVRRYVPRMEEITARSVESWPRGEPFALRPRSQAITLDVILRVVFGIEDEARLDDLRELIPRLARTSTAVVWLPALHHDLGPLSPWGRFLRLRARIDGCIQDEIDRRRAAIAQDPDVALGDDVLSLLLRARHEDGAAMTDSELRDQLMTVLIAGHETTATGLAWIFERLARHPSVLERLLAELATGDETYLDAVIKETLRVRPVVVDVARAVHGAPHVVGEGAPGGPWEVPVGSLIVLSIPTVQRRPDLFADPTDFRPERWLDAGPGAAPGQRPDRRQEPYAWIPFGGGTRRCLGASFATAEMKAVVRTVLSRVRLRTTHEPGERIVLRNVTLCPREDGVVVVDPLPAARREPGTGTGEALASRPSAA